MRQPPSSVRGLLRVGLTLSLLTAAVAGSATRAAAQPAPAQRWDGFFEVLSAPSSWRAAASGAARGGQRDQPVVEARDERRRALHPLQFGRDEHRVDTARRRFICATGAPTISACSSVAPLALNGTLSADANHVAFEIRDSYSRPQPSARWPACVRRMYTLLISAPGCGA